MNIIQYNTKDTRFHLSLGFVEVADPTGEEEEVADPTKRKKNATEKKKAPTSESRKQHMNTHHQR